MVTAFQAAESSFQGVGGLKIFTRSWRPTGGAPRAVLVISHGFNSHSGQYAWAAEQFAAAGLAVHALDHRGRGKSGGERFYVQSYSDYTSDLSTFIKLVKSQEPGLPVFLIGHSAGGVIACGYALEHQAELRGLICESFAFKVPAPDFVLGLVKLISSFAPRLGVLKLQNKDFSRDPAVVAALNSDPLTLNENQPAQTVAELVRANERLKREFPKIKLPLFILHGTLDKATQPAGSQFFQQTAGSTDKTLKLYEGHFHDLLADVGKEGVVADILAWIGKRV
ncbi:MAG TPA: alpha/beta hydrolase [Rhizobacter sp.]|nr:alpha/beta hydrolase [Rhizobacter sp.]